MPLPAELLLSGRGILLKNLFIFLVVVFSNLFISDDQAVYPLLGSRRLIILVDDLLKFCPARL